MNEDAEEIVYNDDESLMNILSDGITGIKYKLLLFIFIIYLFISSDIFIKRVLAAFSGTVEGNVVTPYGNIVTGILLVLCYGLIDFLITQEII